MTCLSLILVCFNLSVLILGSSWYKIFLRLYNYHGHILHFNIMCILNETLKTDIFENIDTVSLMSFCSTTISS